MSTPITNILTIDLEDYYMVSAFNSVVRREDWGIHESRIEKNTCRLLEILAEAKSLPLNETGSQNRPDQTTNFNGLKPDAQCQMSSGVKATFFCLGWVAEKYPHLIREIDRHGHEIACHGYDHRLVYGMKPEEFRQDVRKSKGILEDITGKVVMGHRAASYTVTEKSLWALRVLAEEGYRYDSSIFPVHHDFYGIPKAPRFPFVVDLNSDGESILQDSINLRSFLEGNSGQINFNAQYIIEFPATTVRLFGVNAPMSGGGYMRFFPYAMIKKGLKMVNEQEKYSFVFYLHPWEIDPGQPRFKNATRLSRFRHYLNLDKAEERLKRLMSDFKFSSFKEVYGIV